MEEETRKKARQNFLLPFHTPNSQKNKNNIQLKFPPNGYAKSPSRNKTQIRSWTPLPKFSPSPLYNIREKQKKISTDSFPTISLPSPPLLSVPLRAISIPIPDNDAARYLMEAGEREIDPPMRRTKRREKKAGAREERRRREERKEGGGRQWSVPR